MSQTKTLKVRVKDKHVPQLNRMARAVTRKEARQRGLARYFTGKKCPVGHVAERYTVNSTCVECAPLMKAKCYAADPVRRVRHNSAYYAANSEAVKSANAQWRAKNSEEMRAIHRRHYEANKPVYYVRTRLREKHIRQATPPWVDLSAITDVYRQAAILAEATGIPHDVDHIVPLRGKNVCGLHVHWNLRPLPASDNRSKGNSEEWTCECGVTHERDVNAARNILARGLASLEGGTRHD